MVLLLLVLSFQSLPQCQNKLINNLKEQQLDSLINAQIKKYSIPGLEIAIIDDSKIIFSEGYGYRELNSNKEVDENTIFEVASLSKPVFAYAILRLASKDVIDLDEPIYHYYVDDDIKDDDRSKLITPRIILNHSTGFPNWARKRKLKMKFTPGTKFNYSGEAFVYLQKAISKITGKSVEEIIQEEVFEPLNMNNSSYTWKKSYDENFAYGHKKRKKYPKKWKPKGINVAASLHTTASDYAKFLIAVLEGKSLSEKIWKDIFTPQIKTSKHGVFWSNGFGLEKVNNNYNIWHWGHNVGFRAYFLLSKECKSGFIYLTNSDKGLKLANDLTLFLSGSLDHPSLRWF